MPRTIAATITNNFRRVKLNIRHGQLTGSLAVFLSFSNEEMVEACVELWRSSSFGEDMINASAIIPRNSVIASIQGEEAVRSLIA